MGEGTHRPSETAAGQSRNRGTMFVVGTLVTIVAGAAALQLTRPKTGIGAPNPTAATTAPGDRHVARVNGQLITWQQLAEESIAQHGTEVLDNLINRTLIQKACAEKGIQVTGAEIQKEILKISTRFGLDTDTWYKMLEAERGLTVRQYQRDVIYPMLCLKKLSGREVQVTKQDLANAYEDNYGEKIKARMIMLDSLRRAQTAHEKVMRDPENFDQVAAEMSIEPQSRALGGSFPPIRRHSGSAEEIREKAFRMKPGEISGIIQIGLNRYVILKCEGRTQKVDHDPKDVQQQLVDDLREQKVQMMIAEAFKDIRDHARIDNYLTGVSSGTNSQVSYNSSLKPPVQSATATGQARVRR